MTWTQFSKSFFENYMARSLCKGLQYNISTLRQGFISVVKYYKIFHELSIHASMIHPT